MNFGTAGGDSNSNISFVNFNQDCTSLAIGTKIGYKLLALSQVDKLEPPIYENEKDDVRIVERLFSSSLVAIVNVSTPRKLKICHFKKGTEICNYSYSNTILAVKLNRARLVVCLEESLYIHNIRDMKVLHTIRETPPNPQGLCALSVSTDNCFLAYPGNTAMGEVQIFDADTLAAKVMIPAHDNPLVALAFNVSGNKIATASDKGTVIRVFSVQDGVKLYEFRRGVKRCVSIYSLAFSADSLFLCASSNTETVHIFKLEDHQQDKQLEEPQGWMGYFGKALQSSAGYLPTQVTDMLNQGRDFASIHLPFTNIKTICAIVTIQKILRVIVVSADGYIYFYNLDITEGGDCTLVKQHKLDGTPETAANPSAEEAPADAKGATTGGSGGPSYASTVRNADSPALAETEKIREMMTATADNAVGKMNTLKLDDDTEFPPMT